MDAMDAAPIDDCFGYSQTDARLHGISLHLHELTTYAVHDHSREWRA